MAEEKRKKTCYYEVLGVDRKCEGAEIKASYRRLALKMHPDKASVNNLTAEEATKQFQQIQEAYSVLSDAQERAWYDAHREQILRGDDEAGEDPFKTRINLYKYFSSGCFNGFGDGPGGFYTVYSELFEAIEVEEAEWEDADDEHHAMPPLGNSGTEWVDVASFYRHWNDFCSRKAFGHADKWNPKEAENRQIRRAMEQENKKARQVAKKEFNAEVRQLVAFVQKRDPRVAAHKKAQAKDAQEKTQREVAEKESRRLKEAQDRKERKEAARKAEEERWAEAAAARDARIARGEVVSDDSDEESDTVDFYCEPCRKHFKSEKAFDQHAKSKKHLQLVARLRKELEEELDDEVQAAAERESSESEVDLEAGDVIEDAITTAVDGLGPAKVPAPSNAGLQANVRGRATPNDPQNGNGGSSNNVNNSNNNEDDEDEDEDDAFVARFAAMKRPQQATGDGAGHKDGGIEEEGAASEDDATEKEQQAKGSKKAQRRAQQKAVLLEKKAEKENVKELVDSCRKAQKGAAGGQGGAAAVANDERVCLPCADPEGAAPPTTQSSGSGKQSANATNGVGQEARCSVCQADFPSRSKLFQHITATGHAALKEVEAGGSRRGKKKR